MLCVYHNHDMDGGIDPPGQSPHPEIECPSCRRVSFSQEEAKAWEGENIRVIQAFRAIYEDGTFCDKTFGLPIWIHVVDPTGRPKVELEAIVTGHRYSRMAADYGLQYTYHSMVRMEVVSCGRSNTVLLRL